MNQKFQQYCFVCVTILFGYQPNPVTYKLVTGIIELAGGLALILRDTRKVGCVVLIITMAGAVQTLICLKEYKESVFPSCVFLALCFLYVVSGRKVSLEKSKTEQQSRLSCRITLKSVNENKIYIGIVSCFKVVGCLDCRTHVFKDNICSMQSNKNKNFETILLRQIIDSNLFQCRLWFHLF